MKITGVRTVLYEIPLTRPIGDANGPKGQTHMASLAVFIDTDEGVSGVSVGGGGSAGQIRSMVQNLLVGRDPQAEVPLQDAAVSRRHFRIQCRGASWIVTEPIVEVPPAATQAVSVRVRVGPDAGKRGSNPIHFEVRALNHDDVFVREKASFLLP